MTDAIYIVPTQEDMHIVSVKLTFTKPKTFT